VSASVRIRKAQPEDSRAIAALHARQIPWGLLSRLGEEFVGNFYEALFRSPFGFGFLAEENGRLLGFATGVVDWRPFYKTFLRSRLGLAVRALISGLGEGRWRRLLETSRYAASDGLPPAELVSIALEPDARGSGVGKDLVHCVLEEFSARRVNAVRVTAGSTNAPANRLYERAGFRLYGNVEIHPGETAAVYVISLGSEQRYPVLS
jgi:ribosomal protein S18 acetylase RimI-like enzyme